MGSLPNDSCYMATADIKNCFYQCGVPPEWSEFFALDAVTGEEAAGFGQDIDIWGVAVAPAQKYYPVLRVLPMGWTWSFWIVQTLHEEVLGSIGLGPSELL
eukprot:1005666-Alexandrium_andersonii.AAC.1